MHQQYKGTIGRIRTVAKFNDMWYYGFIFYGLYFYPIGNAFIDEESAWNFLQFLAEDGRWEKL